MQYDGFVDKKQQHRYLSILLDEKALVAIDDFRFSHRIASRTEAIRALIKIGLQSVSTPKQKT